MITIQRSKGGDISDFCPKKDLVFYFTSSKYSSTFLSTVEFSFYRTAQNRDFRLYCVVYVRIYMYKCVSKLCTVLCASLISFHDQSKLVFVLDLLPSPYLSHSKQKWYHIFQQICSFFLMIIILGNVSPFLIDAFTQPCWSSAVGPPTVQEV